MNSNHFLRSLPLMAAALGRKYGIQVIIGGDKAATNGRRILLPSLPLDSSSELVALARGYLDHEAAHIRATDIGQIKAANLSALEFTVFNILEDWRVEKILGEMFPGCRCNFDWLVKHFFDKDSEGKTTSDQDILRWILLEARSWSAPVLRTRAGQLHSSLVADAPSLISALDPIMSDAQEGCHDTQATIAFACRLVEALTNFAHSHQDPEGPEAEIVSAVESLLTKPAEELPAGLGQQLEDILTGSKAASNESACLQVAQIRPRKSNQLSPSAVTETQSATMALKRRLQSLLQASTMQKVRPGHHGRLDNGSLHKLFINDSKLFRRSGVRIALNTAVHLLIDTSASMACQMEFVSATAYALCDSLSRVPGVALGATAFPGDPVRLLESRDDSWATVSPIFTHGQALHQKFQLTAEGPTPMGEAIWWALQEMVPLKQSRKVIFILTDGEPDHIDNTKIAIAKAQHLGYEIYGLGLDRDSVKGLLPGRSAVIKQLSDLPSVMFRLLGAAITGKESS